MYEWKPIDRIIYGLPFNILITVLYLISNFNFLYRVVVNTLEKVDGNRKCYRLIGGVLCEKTVKDVLPVLVKNKEEVC